MYSLIIHGRKLVQLQKWCHLSLLANPLQNCSSFSSAIASAADLSSQDCRKGQTFTVSYLVDSLGLTTKLAESIWRKVSSEEKGNPDSVLSLLRSNGFTESQISSIITIYPKLLIEDAEKSIGPKLQFLQSRGASSSDEFTEILSKVPKILGKKGNKTISIYYDFVREIIEADNSSKHEKLCVSLAEGSMQENRMRNLLVLRELGMPQKLLFSLLISSSSTLCGKDRFEETLKKVVEMGFDPTTPKFVNALNVVYKLSDKAMEERVNVYKSLGFDAEYVWEMFKRCPVFLGFSEKKILSLLETFLGLGFTKDEFVMMVGRFPPWLQYSKESVTKKTEFLVKKMNWPLKAVVMFPQVISCSMEKRIVPRCNIIQALRSKGLLRSGLPSLASVLSCTNEAFLNKYVVKHDNKQLVAELTAIFADHCAS